MLRNTKHRRAKKGPFKISIHKVHSTGKVVVVLYSRYEFLLGQSSKYYIVRVHGYFRRVFSAIKVEGTNGTTELIISIQMFEALSSQ